MQIHRKDSNSERWTHIFLLLASFELHQPLALVSFITSHSHSITCAYIAHAVNARTRRAIYVHVICTYVLLCTCMQKSLMYACTRARVRRTNLKHFLYWSKHENFKFYFPIATIKSTLLEFIHLKIFPSGTGLCFPLSSAKSPSHRRYLLTVALSPSLSGSSFVNVYDGASMFQSSTSYRNRGIINY